MRLLLPGVLCFHNCSMQATRRLPCQTRCSLRTPCKAMNLAALSCSTCPPQLAPSLTQSMLLQSTHQRTRTTQSGSRVVMQMAPPTLRAQGMVGAKTMTMGKHQLNITIAITAMDWLSGVCNFSL